MKRLFRATLLIATVLLLTACNISVIDDKENTSADGIWAGTLSWDSGEPNTDILALSYDGRLIIYSNEAALLFDGFYDVENHYLFANTDEHWLEGAAGDYQGQAELNGTVSEHEYMLLNLSASDGVTGEFSLHYLEDVYERSASLTYIEGLWAYSGATSNEDLVFEIEYDGDLYGQDGYGCIFDGEFSRPSRSHNIYQVSLEVSSCGDYNGRYEGLATQVDAAHPDDTLIISASNGRHAFYYDFTNID